MYAAPPVSYTHLDAQVQEAKRIAEEDMGVQFIDVDVQLFKQASMPVQQGILEGNKSIQDVYDHIQKINEQFER